MIKIAIALALCLASGNQCILELDARITSYVPEWGGINCMEPCDRTAFMTPVLYGETAACGPGLPWNAEVTIFTPWGQIVERRCQDRGGAITNDRVDVAMSPAEHDQLPLYGNWPVLWSYPAPEPPRIAATFHASSLQLQTARPAPNGVPNGREME